VALYTFEEFKFDMSNIIIITKYVVFYVDFIDVLGAVKSV